MHGDITLLYSVSSMGGLIYQAILIADSVFSFVIIAPNCVKSLMRKTGALANSQRLRLESIVAGAFDRE
jgi:hypothetical protein